MKKKFIDFMAEVGTLHVYWIGLFFLSGFSYYLDEFFLAGFLLGSAIVSLLVATYHKKETEKGLEKFYAMGRESERTIIKHNLYAKYGLTGDVMYKNIAEEL